MTDEPTTTTKIIKAEDAPLGVPLWAADSEVLLRSTRCSRSRSCSPYARSRPRSGSSGGRFVSGTTRAFRLGDEIVVEVTSEDRGSAEPEPESD